MGHEKKKKKKEKKQKKERHSKKRKHSSSDGVVATSTDNDAAAGDSSASCVQVKLDTNIEAAARVSSGGGMSWGTIFAAAATIEPEKLDDAFLSRTQTQSTDEGLEKISRLAKEQQAAVSAEPIHKKSKSSLCTEKADEYASESKVDEQVEDVYSTDREEREEMSLEGRMVPHPDQDGEMVMVLVDTQRLKVYSALERTDEGELIPVGRVEEGQVILSEGAFKESTNNTNSGSIKGEDSILASFSFPTDPDDHCESPLESYRDVTTFLEALCQDGVSKESLALYDPYYCNGAVVRNLNTLGFPRVHNENKDCYKVWSTGIGYPEFDALITNPPYSGDHVEKLIHHVTHKNFGSRPWFLLMPTWAHKKQHYKRALERNNIHPFYLVPKKRYVYLPPKDFRNKRKSDVHKKSSPFVSMWYIWGGTTERTNQWIALYQQSAAEDSVTCDLARSQSALRDLRRKGKKR